MRGYAIAPFAKRKGREQAKPKEPTTKRGMHGEGPGGRSHPTTASLTPSAVERQFEIIDEAPAAVILGESQRFSGRNVHPEGKGNGKLPRTGPEAIIGEVTQMPLSQSERGASKRSDASGVCTGWGREAARSRL